MVGVLHGVSPVDGVAIHERRGPSQGAGWEVVQVTATDELLRLLDESGVEYMVDCGYRDVFWNFGESGTARASAIGTRGLVQMIVTGITPADALESARFAGGR